MGPSDVLIVPGARPARAVALVYVVLVLGTGCGRHGPAAQNATSDTGLDDGSITVSEGSPLRGKLKLETVESRPVRSRLLAPASVEADPARMARIVPPLAGQVKQLFVRQGELVTKGQPLFVLDAPDLVTARADFLRAKSVLVQAENALRRQQDLFEHAIAAKREVEDAQTAHDVARDDLKRSTVRLKLLGIDSGDLDEPLTVRSPLSGQVLSLATSPGEFRNDVTTPLLVVADLSSLWITASVPERDVQRVHVGDDALARVAAFPSLEFKGRILFIENVLETDTRSVKVRIQFDNTEGRLKPGMFATVSFLGAAAPAIVLPTTALQVGETTYVWVERSPWTFVRRPVQLASENSESAVVADGLKPGERVVVQNGALLQ
jgi:membrane fusion protein, heavy metal efflux system